MKVTLDHTQDETNSIRTFYFTPEKPLRYTAGQFIELTIDHPSPDERGTRRWFTLSSSPTQELLTITTRYAGDDNTSSFKRTLFNLQPGAHIDMSDPMGDFVLPKDASIPLVFVAGGIGITPMHSMLQYLVDNEEKRMIRCMYGVEKEADIIFQDTLQNAHVHATIVVNQPSDAWGGERGHITADMIIGVEAPTEDTLIYLSGPEGMIQALSKELQARGLDKRQIVTDEFPGYKGI